jgi:hypothetical protein
MIKRSEEEEEETVRLLVKMGGDALALDTVGNVSLHCCGHVETVKFLVEEMGVDVPATEGADGDTPLNRAAAGGHVETVTGGRGNRKVRAKYTQ